MPSQRLSCACGPPPPIITPYVLQIKHAGFTEPSPIQAQAWPVAMEGRDLVAIAKTGSGKTCGFLLPGFMHIKKSRNDPRNGPTVLVLAPTRELANQIQVEANKFGKFSGLRNTYVHITGSRAFASAPRVSTCRSLVALSKSMLFRTSEACGVSRGLDHAHTYSTRRAFFVG